MLTTLYDANNGAPLCFDETLVIVVATVPGGTTAILCANGPRLVVVGDAAVIVQNFADTARQKLRDCSSLCENGSMFIDPGAVGQIMPLMDGPNQVLGMTQIILKTGANLVAKCAPRDAIKILAGHDPGTAGRLKLVGLNDNGQSTN